MFIGFPPVKAGEFSRELERWEQSGATVVFFESTRRLAKTLSALAGKHPQVSVAIGRELTKLHEEIVVMSAQDALAWTEGHSTLKGEAVVAVAMGEVAVAATSGFAKEDLIRRAKVEFSRGASLRDLLRTFKDQGISRSDLYQILLEAREQPR